MNEQSEIRNLKGIGAKTEELFHKMGILPSAICSVIIPEDMMYMKSR